MVVAVFAASSSRVDSVYCQAAHQLGALFAKEKISVVFGGGGIGLMGCLADSVLSNNGHIIGVIPQFMVNEGWGHPGVKEMISTATMSERKDKILEMSDAVVALPGGIGTLEELSQTITQKQLGLWDGHIIWLNTNGFYDSLLMHFDKMMEESFMRREHSEMWTILDTPEEVIETLTQKVVTNDWRKIAKI